jgi:hypothetical protein
VDEPSRPIPAIRLRAPGEGADHEHRVVLRDHPLDVEAQDLFGLVVGVHEARDPIASLPAAPVGEESASGIHDRDLLGAQG